MYISGYMLDDQVVSMDGSTSLKFQADGNLVLRFGDDREAIWSSKTNPVAAGGYARLRYETGNLVVRDADDNWQWGCDTANISRPNNGYHLVVITQCAFLIYEDMNGQLHSLWNTEDDGCKNVGCDCSGIDSYSLPTLSPTQSPTPSPTSNPTKFPTPSPTASPIPTSAPTEYPTQSPIPSPTNTPTMQGFCVWNAKGADVDHYNGQYNYGGIQNGKCYFVKDSCSTSTGEKYYLQASFADEITLYWVIYNRLDPFNYYDKAPYCNEQPINNGNVPYCSDFWLWYDSNSNSYQAISDMTLSQTNCPSLECDQLVLSNSGNNKCNQVFTRYTASNQDNVFRADDGTFLFFNQNAFRWYCSDNNYADVCVGTFNIFEHYIHSEFDGWYQIYDSNPNENSFSITVHASNGDVASDAAIFTCVATQNPTTSPSKESTYHPTQGKYLDCIKQK